MMILDHADIQDFSTLEEKRSTATSDNGLFKPLKGAQYEFPEFRMFPQKG